jgi:hypothetical protein
MRAAGRRHAGTDYNLSLVGPVWPWSLAREAQGDCLGESPDAMTS